MGQPATTSKDSLLCKKTAFSDVKNLLRHPNTPNIPSKSSGLKKPCFGSQFTATQKVTPNESKGAVPRTKKNFKPRIDLTAIDYSDSEPHLACKPSGQRDILYDFWSAASSNFEVYQDVEPKPRAVALPEMIALLPPTPSHFAPNLNLFDDIPHLSFDDL